MGRRLALLAAICCGVAVLRPVAAGAQTFEDYLALVDRYPRDPESASLTLSRWAVPRGRIRDHVNACLPIIAGFAGDVSQCRGGNRRALAAMLHSETGRLLIDAQPDVATFHIEMAERLLQRNQHSELMLGWYRFVVMLNLSHGRVEVASGFAARASERFPRSADGFLLRGLVKEAALMFNNRNLRDVRSADRLPRGVVDYGERTGSGIVLERLLNAAAAEYRQAVAIAPKLVEARLHLAWIWALLEESRGAAALTEIASDAPDSTSRYLAQMFLGAVAERDNRWPDAAAAYRAARAVDGRHQSACTALSYVAGRTPGYDTESLAASCVDLDTSHDPWWAYRVSAQDPALLAWLRAEVRRE